MDPHPRYEVLEKIASGSFATVYRGRDNELGRDVAIKQIHDQFLENPQQLERYWQEAQLLASFQHPNIVTIYDLVRERGWLILELMQGSLGKLTNGKPMELNSLRTSLGHCLRALKFLHAHGIVHGDIKPSNIMVDRRKRVKIGDFGLARRASDDDGSLIKGTTKYMAPEVLSDEFGEVGPASDLYSLGFAAYELMCGERFESLFPGLSAFGRDKQVAWMMWQAAPDRRLPEIKRVLENVPEDLARCIQKLTCKQLSGRYQTADEALSELNIDLKLVKPGEEAASEEAAAKTQTETVDKKRRMLVIGAFSASLVLSLTALFWPDGKQSGAPTIKPLMGIVREVVLGQNKLVIDDEHGVPQEVVVGEKPLIKLNDDRFILLREITRGDRVEITNGQSPEGKQTVNVLALRPETSRGEIKSLNAPDQELVVGIDDGRVREEVPLRAPNAAKILLNSKEVSLGELQVGDKVEVSHLKGPKGQAARDVIRLEALRRMKITGFISAVDPSRRRIALDQRGGRDQQKLDLPVADNCTIVINGQNTNNGRPFSLADLQPNDRVRLVTDLLVVEIDALRQTRAHGVMQGITESQNLFVIQTDERQQIAFQADATTEINLGREPAKVSDLRRYDRVDVVYAAGPANADNPQVHRAITVDVTRPPQATRTVIVIGMQNHADRNLTRLQYPLRDIRLLQDVLIRRYACPAERVLMLSDANRQTLEKQLPDWLSRTSNATQVIVYFTGHGYTDASGQIYLAAQDTKFDNLPQTGVKLEWLVQQLDQCVGKEKLLLLDASHSGNGADLARQPSTQEMVESLKIAGYTPKSTAIIASCKKGETGKDWKIKQHGLFAYITAEAFSGRGDKNRDLYLDARELFDYVKQGMSATNPEAPPTQTPVLFMP